MICTLRKRLPRLKSVLKANTKLPQFATDQANTIADPEAIASSTTSTQEHYELLRPTIALGRSFQPPQ